MIPLRQSEHDFFLTSEFIYILARWTVLAQSWDHVNQRKSILVDQSPGPPDKRGWVLGGWGAAAGNLHHPLSREPKIETFCKCGLPSDIPEMVSDSWARISISTEIEASGSSASS